jgi:hypothetical protein
MDSARLYNGRGKDDLTHKPNRPVRESFVYPLRRRLRDLLSERHENDLHVA